MSPLQNVEGFVILNEVKNLNTLHNNTSDPSLRSRMTQKKKFAKVEI